MIAYAELKPILDGLIREKAEQLYNTFTAQHQDIASDVNIKNYWQALLYACHGEGKRIRASLIYYFAMARGCEGFTDQGLKNFICAIEWLHTYSLVHDDLPCMDNDDFRRGRATVHKKFNEALAMLTGDALLTDAFHLLSDYKVNILDSIKVHAIQILGHAAGSRSMILGQAMDLSNSSLNTADQTQWSEDRLRYVHLLKTGKLMGASCSLGVCLGKQDFKTTIELTSLAQHFGEKLGLVFQMIDDILDASSETGKSIGKDKASGKITFLDLYGEAKTKKIAKDITSEELVKIESIFLCKTSFEHLSHLVHSLVNRRS